MIQFPICPPEAFSWWVAQCFCSYVFVQYLSLVFIETPSYGYIHLNFRLSVDFLFYMKVTLRWASLFLVSTLQVRSGALKYV